MEFALQFKIGKHAGYTEKFENVYRTLASFHVPSMSHGAISSGLQPPPERIVTLVNARFFALCLGNARGKWY
jgi:hypothetical protein